MTDRVKGFIITLERDLREEDVECVVNALYMIKNVTSIKPIQARPYDDSVIRQRVLTEINADVNALLAKWNKT